MTSNITTEIPDIVSTPEHTASPLPSPVAAEAAPAADRASHVRVRRGNTHDAEELKRAFLESAAKIFAEGGLEAVSMRAVAAAVGVSPMTPYRYFADKAELLTGLWDQAAAALSARLRAAVDAQTDARARLRAHLETFIAYWEEHPDQYRLVYMTERTTRREDRSVAQTSAAYAQLLAIAQEANRDLARELGVSEQHALMADEVRLLMTIGYLHSTMINRRYPWSDLAALKAAYVEQTLATIEQIIVQGPEKAPKA
jgi:AcrR family transcriptional regulator